MSALPDVFGPLGSAGAWLSLLVLSGLVVLAVEGVAACVARRVGIRKAGRERMAQTRRWQNQAALLRQSRKKKDLEKGSGL